jgi:serine/threonine protein phosphatase PrpC
MALEIVEQAGRTDVGRQRNANEDSLVVRPPFFAVADGMGGAKAGEVASAIAAEAFERAGAGGEPAEAQLERIAHDANRRIYELAVSDESRRGMGTTLTAAKIHGQEVSLGHVGDSRAYRMRDGELEQLTRDHSLVAELERSGQITPEAAEHHPQRSIITRALGPEPDVEVDTCTVPSRAGDVFLLCSDGLTSMIADDEMAAILRSSASLEEAADALVRAANQSGGKDNITVVLFRLGEADPEDGARAGELPGEDDTIAGQLRAADVRTAAADRAPADAATGPTAPAAADGATRGRPGPPADPPAGAPAGAAVDRAADSEVDPTVIRRAPAPVAGRGKPGKRRRRRGRTLAKGVLGLVLVAAVLGGLYALSRQIYFVGTNEGGLVTIYRGVPYELPFGGELYVEDYASGMPARAIPAARRRRVLDHEWRSREDAVDLVRSLERGQLESAGAAG